MSVPAADELSVSTTAVLENKKYSLSYKDRQYIEEQHSVYLNLTNSLPSTKNFYVEEYLQGSECAVTKKPRRISIKYFCDETQSKLKLVELQEVDWCIYHAKVATKFMCGAGLS